jgi:hypothetical protein
MAKNIVQPKYCNCNISSDQTILKPNVNNSFCQKCGSILLKSSNGNIYYSLKPRKKNPEYELNPIKIIQAMKKKTEEDYPYIYNLYNNPEGVEDRSMRSISIYLKYRKYLIQKLQKLMKQFDYHDIIFYQTLFFLDTFLSHDITLEMSEKAILYYLVGYFLCSLKLRETDVYEPYYESFLDIEKGIYLAPSKIVLFEVICLKRIKYNIFSYSAYDWMTQLISNGVVFSNEVDNTNEIIMIKGHRHSLVNTINKYAVKLLLNLTIKDVFFKYSPMYLAFSIIQIAREKYIQKNMIKPKLYFKLIRLYDVNFDDYKDCYEEINSLVKEETKQNLKDNKDEEESKKELKKMNQEKKGSVDKIEKSLKNKNLYVPNKIRSSNAVINIDKDDLTNKTIEETNIFNELNKNRRNKTIRKKHYSIDCTNNGFKNNESLPLIFINYNRDKNPVGLTLQNQYTLNTENEEQKQEKNKSNDKLEEIHLNNIRLVNKKLLTSTKLPKINFEEIVNNKSNNIEQGKELNGLRENGKKRYKLKANKNFEIKVAFP